MNKEIDVNYRNEWIRFGVSGPRTRDPKDGRGWRCFVGDGDEIPLRDWSVIGNLLSGVNFKPTLDPTARNKGDLIGWIAVFGDVSIREDVAVVSLRKPH